MVTRPVYRPGTGHFGIVRLQQNRYAESAQQSTFGWSEPAQWRDREISRVIWSIRRIFRVGIFPNFLLAAP